MQQQTFKIPNKFLAYLFAIIAFTMSFLTLTQSKSFISSHIETKQPVVKQSIIAPILTIPYIEHLTSINTVLDDNGESRVETKDVYNEKHAVLLPDELDIQTKLVQDKSQIWTDFKLTGSFNYSELLIEPDSGKRNIRWDLAKLLIGLEDLSSIQNDVEVIWDDESLDPESSISPLENQIKQGFSVQVIEPEDETQRIHVFEISFRTQGFTQLSIAPLGKQTMANVELLPEQSFSATNIKPNIDGETIKWNISPLTKPYTHYWIKEEQKNTPDLTAAMFGISLDPSPSQYESLESLMNYAEILLLVMLITLLALDLQRQKLNFIHYLLTGVSLSIWLLGLWWTYAQITWSILFISSLIVWCVLWLGYLGRPLGWLPAVIFVTIVGGSAFAIYSIRSYSQWEVWLVLGIFVLPTLLLLGSSSQKDANSPTS